MSLLSRIKALAPRKPADTPRPPEVVYLANGSGVGIVQWNSHIAAQAAMQHPIVYRALNKLGESVQQVRWRVEEDPHSPATGVKSKIKDLQALMDRPNDDMSPAMLRYWMTLNWLCYGRVPLKVGFSAVDRTKPNGIYPLETRHVNVVLNNRSIPVRYKYGSGEDSEAFTARQTWTPETRGGFVDQIWKPALKGYQHKDEQNTPLKAIGLPAEVIRVLLVRAIQTAEGHPNVRYLVTCDKTLTEQQKTAIKSYLNDDHSVEGPDAGKVPILQNAGNVEIHKLDNDLSDIHSKMPSDDMARLIFGAFGIPIALAGMGAADGAKFAGNYIESRQAFWQDTVIPAILNPLAEGLSIMVCPSGVRIMPELDDIPALKDARIGHLKELTKVNFMTLEEKRMFVGLPKEPDGNLNYAPAPTIGASNNDPENKET